MPPLLFSGKDVTFSPLDDQPCNQMWEVTLQRFSLTNRLNVELTGAGGLVEAVNADTTATLFAALELPNVD